LGEEDLAGSTAKRVVGESAGEVELGKNEGQGVASVSARGQVVASFSVKVGARVSCPVPVPDEDHLLALLLFLSGGVGKWAVGGDRGQGLLNAEKRRVPCPGHETNQRHRQPGRVGQGKVRQSLPKPLHEPFSGGVRRMNMNP
jgi:hypothetical protein